MSMVIGAPTEGVLLGGASCNPCEDEFFKFANTTSIIVVGLASYVANVIPVMTPHKDACRPLSPFEILGNESSLLQHQQQHSTPTFFPK